MRDAGDRIAATRIVREGAVATIGTFDGVHRGHRALLDRLVRRGSALGVPAVVVTFEPHPAEVLRAGSPPALLTPGAERIEALATTGIDYVLLLRFDRRLAEFTPDRFVDDVLVHRLRIRHLVIGHDHAIGKDRSGDPPTLTALGRTRGFEVEVVSAIETAGGPISSSAIRRALGAGDVVAAARALGRPYTLRGTVVRGAGRGRGLGFPTANFESDDARKLVPAAGVYAARAAAQAPAASRSSAILDGLLHIGPRPTFGEDRTTLEFFAFDFGGDLYGHMVEVALCERIRGIERFDSSAALIAAMRADLDAGRAVFAAGAGACDAARNSIHFKA